MIRTVVTRFAFNGLAKGVTFTYDPMTDERVKALIEAGLLVDVTPAGTMTTQIISMPSIESAEDIGEVNGEGADQPSGGGGDGPEADDSTGEDGLQGDQGTVAKVAKKR
jgi:hypothetical protein